MKNYYFSTKKMCVGYDNKLLIKDMEIKLREGEILCLIGPNGAGKSTVLKSIAGQLGLLGGTVYLGEDDLSEMKAEELAKRMSVVFTERVRVELKSCRDMVATGRYPYTGWFGILSEEDERIVDEVMRLTHITDISEKDFGKISDGQKQRVMLARAICQEPEIVILDEPTSYLDIKYKLEFLLLLQEMREKRGLTVIMSLHELELAKIAKEFNYNYEYATVRNKKLDDFYNNLSVSDIGTFYYDASGRLSFILYLYDVNKSREVPYFFKVNSSGEVSYSEFFS